MKILVLLGLLGIGSQAFAGANLMVDEANHQLILQAHMVYYGDSVNPQIAHQATEEIQKFWSGYTARPEDQKLDLTVVLNGETYVLKAEITDQIVRSRRAKRMARRNRDAGVNFIRFLKGGNPGDRSYYTDLGSNTGAFYESDDIGKSTTSAHEFGHGLGLPHPDLEDWRGLGRPAIMCPRGTLVDAAYQWDPSAQAGGAGGTMSPYTRRVMPFDVDQLQISKLVFQDGKATLGRATNDLQ